MWNPFAARPLPDAEMEWQLAVLRWLRRETALGPRGAGPLVLPTVERFPPSTLGGADRARELFDQVRAAVGMEGWPIRLEAGDSDRPSEIDDTHRLVHDGGHAPAGTFHVGRREDGTGEAVIRYDPQLVADATALVATFAHELAHALIRATGELPPGGAALEEPATDLAGVWMGFGLFLLSTAKRFGQFQEAGTHGWQMRRQGYLNERALAFAFALQLRLAGEDESIVLPYLRPHLADDLRRAARYSARRWPDLRAAIDGADESAFADAAGLA